MDWKYCVLCAKTYNISGSLSWLPVGYRQAARGARICDTHERRFGNRIPYRLSYRPDIALPISKRYQMAFLSRVCRFRCLISIWYRMTDMELATEFYRIDVVSIYTDTFARYLSNMEWLTSRGPRNYMVSIRHRLPYRPYIRMLMSKRYQMEYLPRLCRCESQIYCRHPMVHVFFSTELWTIMKQIWLFLSKFPIEEFVVVGSVDTKNNKRIWS